MALDIHTGEEEPVWALAPHPLRHGKFTLRETAARIVFTLTPRDQGPNGEIVLADQRVDTALILAAAQNVGFIPIAPEPWSQIGEDFVLPGLTDLNLKGTGGVAHGNTRAMSDVMGAAQDALDSGLWVVVFVTSWDWSFTVALYSRSGD